MSKLNPFMTFQNSIIPFFTCYSTISFFTCNSTIPFLTYCFATPSLTCYSTFPFFTCNSTIPALSASPLFLSLPALIPPFLFLPAIPLFLSLPSIPLSFPYLLFHYSFLYMILGLVTFQLFQAVSITVFPTVFKIKSQVADSFRE